MKLTYPCPNGARLTGTRQAIRRAVTRGKGATTACLDIKGWLDVIVPGGRCAPSARRGR